MKHIKLIAIPILATLLGGGAYSSHAQDAVLIAQQTYLKASNTGVNDWFGGSVAISGDTMVIGADPGGGVTPNYGAAYVFVRNGTNWSQQAYLKASNTGEGDGFGFSAAVSGDTVVIGAPLESSNATGVNGNQSNNLASSSGAAYVFVRDGTNWSQQAYLKASNTGGDDYFGAYVAISGDTVVVGAWGEDSSATGVNGNQSNNSVFNAGAAYVFVRDGRNWSQQAYLKASNPGINDEFGLVAISGDTVVVGADGEASNATGVNGNQSDNSASYAGAAYVFVRSGTNWSQQAYLKASNTGARDEFGLAVAVSGDTIVVASPHEDSDGIGVNGNQGNDRAVDSGAAYIFVRSGTNWTQQAYLKASNAEARDEVAGVAISDDVVVVGGGDDSNATGVNGDQSNNTVTDSGAAYVFLRMGTNWTQQAYLKASNPGANDFFSVSVAVSGGTVVLGAPGEDSNATGVNGNQTNNSATDSGAAYVFTGLGPAAPQLAIEQSADNVRILWPLSASNFVLDETNDLKASPISWTPVPFPYQTNATDVAVTLPLAAGNKFYRLRKP
ncbi:MAG: FG-GAP repeat protein [Verrucomicrobiales bacterium]|nr:FG-GAP repeat protein [Verrucomicrobiales bacterium]